MRPSQTMLSESFSTPKSILVIHVTRIGDTLLTTPSLRALGDFLSNSLDTADKPESKQPQLTFLGHPKRAEVVRHLPYLRRQGCISKTRALWLGHYHARCKRKPYDLAFVYGFDSALVAYALRVAQRVVAFRQNSDALNRRLYRVVELPPAQSLHAVDLLLKLPAAVGITARSRRLDYLVSTAEQNWAHAALTRQLPAGLELLVGLQVASFPTRAYRDWPIEHFLALSERIRARYPKVHFLIFGGSAEQARTEALAKTLGACATSYAGRLTLRQTAALMNQIDLYIGVDTGPTHMMSALQKPMVALYHAYLPSHLLAPLDHPCAYVIDHPLPAHQATPETPMADITVERVWQVVSQALSEHPPQRGSCLAGSNKI
ncbi:MAG: glycosyltransferase family 9 protein [Pseudomonadota bacterium]